MDKIKKNFGFGLMRLPMNGEEVNIEETKEMVDAILNAGFPGIILNRLTKQSLRPLKRFRKYLKAKIRYRVPPAAIVRTAARSIFQSPICLPIRMRSKYITTGTQTIIITTFTPRKVAKRLTA